MNNKYTLITGASGEFGYGLIDKIVANGKKVIVLDLKTLDQSLAQKCDVVFQGNILDQELVKEIFEKYAIDEIYHLAALLSTTAEKNPELAFEVNLIGIMNLLSMAQKKSVEIGQRIKFLFPSTIAIYGVPNLELKAQNLVTESQFLSPITMYGVNKLAAENLGIYYADNYKMASSTKDRNDGIDFRAIRFPGVISAFTLPTGGTSDYAPEMIHAAAKKEAYCCFVRPDTKIPFITMPDAIKALLMLAAADEYNLSSRVYNIGGFAPTAQEIADQVLAAFPATKITFSSDTKRQKMVDSWPADVDDSQARHDWGYTSESDMHEAFNDYLLPNIKALYE